MSTVLILTPIVIGGWPAITAAAAGAASALGLVVKHSVSEAVAEHNANENVENEVEMELAESQVIAQNLSTDQEIVLTKDDVELRVRRDERGRCSVCAKGKNRSKAELTEVAERFTQKMTQCFVYNKVATELKSKGFKTVNEEVMGDDSIRINVRRFVD